MKKKKFYRKLKIYFLIVLAIIITFVVYYAINYYFFQTDLNNVEFSEAQPIELDYDKDKIKNELVHPGILTVAISPPYYPFEYMSDGVLKGFDVECAKLLADDLDLQIQFIQVPFSSLLSTLKDGKKADMAIGGIQVTKQRKIDNDFSTPYFINSSMLLCNNAADLSDDNIAEAIKYKDIKLCAVAGSTDESYLRNNYPEYPITTCDDFDKCAEKLSKGEVDLLLVGQIEYKTSNSPAKYNLKELEYFDNKEEVSIAVPKSKPYILEIINKAIELRWDDKYIDFLINKYFVNVRTQ